MKNLNSQILLKYLVVFNSIFFIILLLLYLYLKSVLNTSVDEDSLIYGSVSIVFFIIEFCILMMSFVLYIYGQKEKEKLKEDIDTLSDYIDNVAAKKYDTHKQIKHYEELLRMALSFKDIVKRLNK